jgi:uncharacterized protein
MRARWLTVALVLAALALVPRAVAQNVVPVPNLAGRVTDLTATLSTEQVAALDRRLAEFEARKGAQVAVLLVPTTKPETIEQFGIRVAEKWKIGRTKVDDGVILIVAKDDRALRIEVGYGLEGAIPDLKASRIIREIITPRFRQGDFYGGIDAGTRALMGLIEGEDLPPPKAQSRPQGGNGFVGNESMFVMLLIVAMVLGAIFTRIAGRFVGSMLTGGAAALITWLLVGTLLAAIFAGAIVFVFTLARGATGLGSAGGRGGGWPGGGGWSGGGWSGGGGGWSGGGGSFGGGGASGRW